MFKIKSISMLGENIEKSTIDFTDGLNIIYGISNTGKSIIVECIDYMFGSKKALFEFDNLYNQVEMVIETNNGEIILNRKINDGKINVTSNNPIIQSGIYLRKRNSKNHDDLLLDDLYLKLIGIEPNKKIVVSQDWKKQNLTFRTFLHSFLIKQEDIIRKESVLLPIQNISQPAFKSGLLYLITGENYLNDDDKDSLIIRRAKKNAVQVYINELLQDLNNKKELIKDKLNDNTENIENEINNITSKIIDLNTKISEHIEKINNISKEISCINDKSIECSNLIEKYEVLYSQYESDIKRISLIVESEINENSIPANLNCPFCNGKIDIQHSDSCIDSAKQELYRLKPQINDLHDTILQIKQEKENYTIRIENLQKNKNDLISSINSDLKPILNKLNNDLKEYKILIEYNKESSILSDLETKYKDKLEDLDNNLNSVEKFKVMDYYTNEILNDLTNEMSNVLKECKYENFTKVEFDKKNFDFNIDNKHKFSQGQGYRTFLNAVTAISLQNYLDKDGIFSPKLLIIDSPRQSLLEKYSEDDEKSMKHGLFSYLINHKNDRQTIIIENKIPSNLDYTGINIIEFTKDNNNGRYGFLKDIK